MTFYCKCPLRCSFRTNHRYQADQRLFFFLFFTFALVKKLEMLTGRHFLQRALCNEQVIVLARHSSGGQWLNGQRKWRTHLYQQEIQEASTTHSLISQEISECSTENLIQENICRLLFYLVIKVFCMYSFVSMRACVCVLFPISALP